MKRAPGASTPNGANEPAAGRGVLAGAFQILDALVDLSEAGLTAVAAASGLPKATAHRLLEQLSDLGAVERRGSRYRVGHRMFLLGRAWQPCPGLRAAAHHPINALARASGASGAVYVLRNGQTMVASGVAGELGSLIPTAVGTVVPSHTAAAKILMVSSHIVTKVATASASWIRESETIREHGMATDREEVTSGVCCAAVPLRDGDGESFAALAAMTTPAMRLPQLARGLRRAGDVISTALRTEQATDVTRWSTERTGT